MYNNGATIERCLRSILDQDAKYELIIVDDNSPDDSVAIAEKMLRPGDRLIRNESNLGAHRNHVKLLELARGSYIQYVHGDDYLLPGALRTLVAYFDDPTVGLVFAPRRVLTDDLVWLRQCGTLHTRFRKLEEHNRGSSLVLQMTLQGLGTNWIGEPTNVMFRRQLAIDAGGIRDDIAHLSDLDLWLRLLLRSTACFVPQELSVREHTPFTGEAFAARTWWLDRLRLLTWVIVDPASPAVIRFIAAVWWSPVWVLRFLEVVLYGPDRRSRIKTLMLAPFREFARAWRLRANLNPVGSQP
ncbi:glycosyltransferase [Mycobacterium mantenii]|nr:glycosyltransferase family 2 protein [Mycobacterium mantenii]MCV7242920.1 glycosyltransferase [Mycobacterium mantenii]